jgi:hypothetical protein
MLYIAKFIDKHLELLFIPCLDVTPMLCFLKKKKKKTPMLCLQPTHRRDANANWMLWSGAAASFHVLELQAGHQC